MPLPVTLRPFLNSLLLRKSKAQRKEKNTKASFQSPWPKKKKPKSSLQLLPLQTLTPLIIIPIPTRYSYFTSIYQIKIPFLFPFLDSSFPCIFRNWKRRRGIQATAFNCMGLLQPLSRLRFLLAYVRILAKRSGTLISVLFSDLEFFFFFFYFCFEMYVAGIFSGRRCNVPVRCMVGVGA